MMSKRDWLLGVVALTVPLAVYGAANEVIPYAIKSVTASSPGFIELLGPGKMVVKRKVVHYRKGKYIRTANIHSLSDVEGNSERCVLHYASYDFSENISVQQSCRQILQVLNGVERQQDETAIPKFKIK